MTLQGRTRRRGGGRAPLCGTDTRLRRFPGFWLRVGVTRWKTGALSEAEGDASLGGIVGRHFHFHAVADDELDEAFAHFARDVGEHDEFIGEFDAELSACEDLHDGALDLDGSFRIVVHLAGSAQGWAAAGRGVRGSGRTAGGVFSFGGHAIVWKGVAFAGNVPAQAVYSRAGNPVDGVGSIAEGTG